MADSEQVPTSLSLDEKILEKSQNGDDAEISKEVTAPDDNQTEVTESFDEDMNEGDNQGEQDGGQEEENSGDEEQEKVVVRTNENAPLAVADYGKLFERFIKAVPIASFEKSQLNSVHLELVKDFLTSSEARKLVFYIDENRKPPSLQVITSLPSQVFSEMAYFIKEASSKSDVLTEVNFEHKVQYGKLTKNTVESLLKIMSHVYVPIFLGNNASSNTE